MTRGSNPRVVVAYRPTDWDQLLERHATAGQARFFLESRDRDVEEVIERHQRQLRALARAEQSIPTEWRRVRIGRADFPGFLFEPDDIVVPVGQDGLVPNLAKYLTGQTVIGVNPDPERYEGTLVRFPVEAVSDLIADLRSGRSKTESRTMVEARLDDGQRLIALNEIYIGHQTHQSSRYLLRRDDESERQSSSGVIIATGTGATGWARSISTERQSNLPLPHPGDRRLVFFVREAWPSVNTGATLTEGTIGDPSRLTLISEMEEGGIAFGDGIETDYLRIGWGQEISVGLAPELLMLVKT